MRCRVMGTYPRSEEDEKFVGTVRRRPGRWAPQRSSARIAGGSQSFAGREWSRASDNFFRTRSMAASLRHLAEREFPLRDGVHYLNHAAVAPWPRRTSEAVCRFARENAAQGALDYAAWLSVEAQLRTQLRELLNAPSAEDIALLKNTSEALSVVAHGLDWHAGDNVVISDQEFPSNRIVWESLSTYGVEVRKVALSGAATPEETMIGACDHRTRLLAISSVQYATGLRSDLERLGRHCRERSILFCVDAIQSLGAIPMDVQASCADFVMADGHKWLLGPEGLAVFYCRAALRDQLTLHQYGWHMVEECGDYDRSDWTTARSARRFECGSPNMVAVHALNASLTLLLETGLQTISRQVLKNTQYLIDKLDDISGMNLISPRRDEQRAGIVSFRVTDLDTAGLYQHLSRRGVVCALRSNALRLSPHFYTSRQTMDAAVELVQSYVSAS